MKRSLIGAILLLLLFSRSALPQTQPSQPGYPDTILHNGKIVTVDDKSASTNPGTVVEALAIKDGKITRLGTSGDILALKGPKTNIIDLKGRTALPGIIDTHSHLHDYAVSHHGAELYPKLTIKANPGETWDSIVNRALAAISEEVKKRQPGEWISVDLPRAAIGQDGTMLDGSLANRRGLLLTQAALDRVAPNNPVHTRARTSARLNSKALEIIKSAGYSPPEELARPEDFYVSNSMNRVVAADFLMDLENLAQVYRKEHLEWAGYGVTTWSSSIRSTRVLTAHQMLDKRGELPIRFAYGVMMGNPQMLSLANYSSDFLWNTGAGTSTDSSYPGLYTSVEPPLIPKDIKDRENPRQGFDKIIEDGVASGLRFVNTHVAGDRALDLVLDAIEKGSARAGLSPEEIRRKRHAADHCTMNPRPDQIPRLKRLGMLMSCAPKYIEDTSPKILRDYGEPYTGWVAPVKSLIDAGVRTVLEIDDHGISEHGTVFHYLGLLVNREVDGKVYAGKERIDRVLALKMSTIWAAEYVLRENVLGSLEPGKFADIIVVDKDYLTIPDKEIGTTKVLLTLVGGKIVHRSEQF
ncbi:MAG TPA: amidohydrolase family protein [Candidatus Acidoferrales bacterium]|nr:amidohydrolase family protein [Candidatus Acidoferrales bacterium]